MTRQRRGWHARLGAALLTDAARVLAAWDTGDVAVHEHAVCAMGRRLLHQMRRPGKAMKQVTVTTYRQDPY